MPNVVMLTTRQVAERFGVDTSAVRRWVAKGQLTPAMTTPGGYYRFAETDLDQFIGENHRNHKQTHQRVNAHERTKAATAAKRAKQQTKKRTGTTG
jgi:excisionase family DNA binding protein